MTPEELKTNGNPESDLSELKLSLSRGLRQIQNTHLPRLSGSESHAEMLKIAQGLGQSLQTTDLSQAKQQAIRLTNLLAKEYLQRFSKILSTSAPQIRQEIVRILQSGCEGSSHYHVAGSGLAIIAIPLLDITPPSTKEFIIDLLNSSLEPTAKARVREGVSDFATRNRINGIDANSPVTWFFAIQGLVSSQVVSGRELLEHIHELINCQGDASRLIDLAKRGYERMQANLVACREFGPDVPVLIGDYKLESSRHSTDFSDIFGFDVSVSYSLITGIYNLRFPATQKDCLTPLGFRQCQLEENQTTGRLGLGGDGVIALIDREDVALALKALRETGKVAFKTVPNQSGTSLSNLPYVDKYSRSMQGRFIGSWTQHPLIATGAAEVKVAFQLLQVSGASRPVYQLQMFMCYDRPEKGANEAERPDLGGFCKLPRFARGVDLREERKLRDIVGKGWPATFISWEDNRATIVFKEPVALQRGLLFGNTVSRPSRDQLIYAVQSMASPSEFEFIFDPKILIPQGATRFNKNPLVLEYGCSPTLTLKRPLNRFPLEFGFDPEFEKLEFPTDSQGRNCLTNWDVSLPLVKPTIAQLEQPSMQSCLALRDIPSGHWLHMLHSFVGDYLEDIKLVERGIKPEAGEAEAECEETPCLEVHELKTKEAYKAPRDGITLVGRWVISHCSHANFKYYIVDSPLYGDALFLFRSYDAAQKAATYFAKAMGRRDAVRLYPDFVRKIIHQEGWKERLHNAILAEIVS